MLKINQVSKSYGDFKAVDDINLHIKKGEIFAFVGPNGAGKTSTIKMITGLLKIDKGSIHINNYDIETQTIEAKKQFGFVSDDPNFFLRLKGREYLKFMADIYEVDPKRYTQLTKKYAKLFQMENSLDEKIASYSHGMRQKIMIIGALLNDPELLILDEPLTGLDPQSAFNLKQLMKSMAAEGKSIFFSTHVLEVAEKLCHNIAIINYGKIIYHGTLDTLKEKHKDLSLEEIFLELTL